MATMRLFIALLCLLLLPSSCAGGLRRAYAPASNEDLSTVFGVDADAIQDVLIDHLGLTRAQLDTVHAHTGGKKTPQSQIIGTLGLGWKKRGYADATKTQIRSLAIKQLIT